MPATRLRRDKFAPRAHACTYPHWVVYVLPHAQHLMASMCLHVPGTSGSSSYLALCREADPALAPRAHRRDGVHTDEHGSIKFALARSPAAPGQVDAQAASRAEVFREETPPISRLAVASDSPSRKRYAGHWYRRVDRGASRGVQSRSQVESFPCSFRSKKWCGSCTGLADLAAHGRAPAVTAYRWRLGLAGYMG